MRPKVLDRSVNKTKKKKLTGSTRTSGSQKAGSSKKVGSSRLLLDKDLLINMYSLMARSRALEERLIKIYKAGEAYFWIGGPGEEAFGVPLGLLVKKGQGPKFDYLHLHYRGTPTVLSLGMPMLDATRLIMNKATDKSTGGRNFAGHYCYPEWNVVPVGSPIEVQYPMAVGTAWVQRRTKTDAISIVTGGDAGTAEGDFASCLVWSSRKGYELPILITVQNNRWGISTSFDGQHGETNIADRGKAFNMKTMVINGNDPIESYVKLSEAFNYIRKERKPVLLEAQVSRLFGHSSASGASKADELDPLTEFEKVLAKSNVLSEIKMDEIKKNAEIEARQAQEQARTELGPEAQTIWDHIYANGENGDWRKY